MANRSRAAVRGVFGVPPASHGGYTLLEVILVLALTTVILGLVAMAIHVQLMLADRSRGNVEEAQIARAMLQRISEDLRNAVPFQSSAGSSSTGDSSTSSSSGTSIASSDSEILYEGGLYGNAQTLQVDTSHRPRANRLMAAGAETTSISFSDLRTVTYSIGLPDTTTPTGASTAAESREGGLCRRDVDRAAFAWTTEKGDAGELNANVELLAAEVTNLEFVYYDGETTSSEWDSATQGRLPTAVRVILSIRRGSSKSSPVNRTKEKSESSLVYDMLVDIPNSQSSSSTSASSSSASSSSSPSSSSSGGAMATP